MGNSLTAAMVSSIAGTQLLGGCSLGKVWQAYETIEKKLGVWGLPLEEHLLSNAL